jgi:hypothetical protein
MIGTTGFRREKKVACDRILRRLQLTERIPGPDIDLGPIVEPSALQGTVVGREAERTDEMQSRAGGEAKPPDVAGIRRNLGLDQNDIKHWLAFVAALPGRRLRVRSVFVVSPALYIPPLQL